MKYDLNVLNSYLERGLLEKNTHPSLPLTIWNYSRSCQFEKKWDEITLACRGLILDNEGSVVASSFHKFFNYEELLWPNQIPSTGDYVYVQEKVDGSLGTLFYYDGQWHLASKGSFASEQAVRGMEIIRAKYNLGAFMQEMVYVCEIIYPENRIVVDYNGEEKVVFLSVTSKGEELHWTTAKGIFHASGIPEEDLVKTEQHFTFGPELYRSLKSKNEVNREGFILRFQPDSFRMKIKFEDYVRLHRILTGFSSKDIWELMMKGEDLEPFLDRVPDEFDEWVRQQVSSFEYGLFSIGEYCGKIHDYFRYGKYNDKENEPTKKEFVEHLKTCEVESAYHPICFAIWDGKPYKYLIWKLMKPKYEKPFWQTDKI
jgi:RNA ligase